MFWNVAFFNSAHAVIQHGSFDGILCSGLLIDYDNVIKLGDFGISRILSRNRMANTLIGTPFYMSPEVIQNNNYDYK